MITVSALNILDTFFFVVRSAFREEFVDSLEEFGICVSYLLVLYLTGCLVAAVSAGRSRARLERTERTVETHDLFPALSDNVIARSLRGYGVLKRLIKRRTQIP